MKPVAAFCDAPQGIFEIVTVAVVGSFCIRCWYRRDAEIHGLKTPERESALTVIAVCRSIARGIVPDSHAQVIGGHGTHLAVLQLQSRAAAGTITVNSCYDTSAEAMPLCAKEYLYPIIAQLRHFQPLAQAQGVQRSIGIRIDISSGSYQVTLLPVAYLQPLQECDDSRSSIFVQFREEQSAPEVTDKIFDILFRSSVAQGTYNQGKQRADAVGIVGCSLCLVGHDLSLAQQLFSLGGSYHDWKCPLQFSDIKASGRRNCRNHP